MTALLMICVPLLVLAVVAGAVLVWAYRRMGHPYDAGVGDISALEAAVGAAPILSDDVRDDPRFRGAGILAGDSLDSAAVLVGAPLETDGPETPVPFGTSTEGVRMARGAKVPGRRERARRVLLSHKRYVRKPRMTWLPWRWVRYNRERINRLTLQVEELTTELREVTDPPDRARAQAMRIAARAAQNHWDSGAPLRDMLEGTDDV